jgi:predicted transcriptional regulator
MKTFTFRYDPHPRKSALSSIQQTLRTGKAEIEKDSISCRSMEEMIKIMTKSRFQVFTTLVEKSPESLTELAKNLGKDLGNVLRDAKILESIGLISLKRAPGRRGEKIKPFALYDRILFECEPKPEKKVSGF